ncbi:MAG: hypothetical protein IJ760_03815 [Bacteroidales bacterium]|nr:hypothetical protein [Bacteroidales bacterium]
MKKRAFALALAVCLLCVGAQAQQAGRERKKNLVVREWNTKAGGGKPYLDNVVTYDAQGRKVEEVEYASYGQKKRTVYEYEGESARCTRQVEYDSKNHVSRIKKFEYNDDGTRRRQYNYKPGGTLESTKEFEYSYQ